MTTRDEVGWGTPSFPDLEIIEEIAPGVGGMGMVFKARDSLGRIVAVKTPKAHQLTDEGRATLKKEARAAGNLDNKNIVRIHYFNEAHDPPFYVMQYVEGEPLDRACQGKDFDYVATLLRDIARALDYAHRHGIVHRDIKPGNILVDHENTPFIADFGLAQAWDPESFAKSEGDTVVRGTPLYLAPEIYQGNKLSDPSADIYALGVTAFYLLTGSHPFYSGQFDVLRAQVVTGDPMLPKECNPSIPEPLQRICLKAMEKRPEDRYASASLLADDLQRYLDGREVYARPTKYRVELTGKARNHMTEIGLWKEQKFIDMPTMDKLLRPYRQLVEGRSLWYEMAHRFPWEAVLLRIGGWLVLVSSCLFLYPFYW